MPHRARIRRHHAGRAFLAWSRCKEAVAQTERTVYQLEYGLLDNDLIQQLKNPSIRMTPA